MTKAIEPTITYDSFIAAVEFLGSGVKYLSDHVVWNLMENSKD